MIKDYDALYGSELLVAAFAQLGPEPRFRISDTSDIVTALYRIKNSGDWGNLFANYAFDTDGIEPRSGALADAIDALQQARILGRQNPDLVDYTVSRGVQINYDQFVKQKVGQSEGLVKELAQRLKAEVNIQDTPPDAEETD